jgi:hypothetical protein
MKTVYINSERKCYRVSNEIHDKLRLLLIQFKECELSLRNNLDFEIDELKCLIVSTCKELCFIDISLE